MSSAECVIYSTGTITIDNFRTKMAGFLKKNKITLPFIETDFYELSIHHNDEHDAVKEADFPDGFLFFKFIIDVEFNETLNIKECVQEISKILEWLWGNRMPAVASCDYEDLLPNNGGYKSSLIPWPIY